MQQKTAKTIHLFCIVIWTIAISLVGIASVFKDQTRASVYSNYKITFNDDTVIEIPVTPEIPIEPEPAEPEPTEPEPVEPEPTETVYPLDKDDYSLLFYENDIQEITVFDGGMAYIDSNQEYKVFIDKEHYSITNAVYENIKQNKTKIYNAMYISTSGDFFGVNSVSGEIILPAVYDNIQICDNVILAKFGNRYAVYKDNILYSDVNDENIIEVILQSNNYLRINGEYLCDLTFTKLTIDGYIAISVGKDGEFMIKDAITQRIGFADSSFNVFIKPKFALSSHFCGEFALAYNFLDNYTLEVIYINKKGETFLALNEREYILLNDYYDGYYCYRYKDTVIFYNPSSDKSIDTGFSHVKNNRIFGEVIIAYTDTDMLNCALYNISGLKLSDIYVDITVVKDQFFIAKKSENDYNLYSYTGEILLSGYSFIDFCGNSLCFLQDNAAFVYAI